MQSIGATCIFGEPPGVSARLIVDEEKGDILIRVELTGSPFCTFVVTQDEAIKFSAMLCSKVIDQRKERK